MRLIRRSAGAADRSNHPAGCLTGVKGSLVAVVTPFRDGRVDTSALSVLCERQIRLGSAALVVCGSTGEAAALSGAEQQRVIEVAVEAAGGRVPVVAGCGAAATEAAVELAVSAARAGAGAVLCAPPPYSKPTQEGIAAHVRAIAAATELPIILYDVPGRTGVAIADETIAGLYETGRISALKDAAGDLTRPPRLRKRCGTGLLQYSGDDGTAAAHRAMGGHGCISVTANVAPGLCAAMHKAWSQGDLHEFGRLRDILAPLHEALFLESNPIPVKAALSLAGLCTGEMRLPLLRATPATVRRLAPLVAALCGAEEIAAGRAQLSVVG